MTASNRLAHLLGESKARSEAQALLRWVSKPVEDRLEKEVEGGATSLRVTLVEYRAIVAFHSLSASEESLPEPNEGDTYFGIPLKVV